MPATSHLVRLAPLALGLALSSCKPPPAEELHYAFLFPRGEAPLDAVLMLGETELGRIVPAGMTGGADEKTYAHVYTLLPRSAGPVSASPGALRARTKSACGDTFTPIKVLDGELRRAKKSNDLRFSAELENEERRQVDERKPELRHHNTIVVPIDWAEPPPDSTAAPTLSIYVDDHGASPKARITIGTLEVDRGYDVFKTQGLGCGGSFPVRAGDEALGTLEIKPRVRAYLISTKPACYRERLITYASANDRGPHPSSSPTIHGPATILPLIHEPNYFLREAPGTARGGGTSSTVAEVVSVPCPAP